MNKKYIVYIHTNKVNKKKYVGITFREPEIRWGKNGNGYRAQPKFYNSIKKYGWDNFQHEIISTDLTETEAKELETYYINLYNSIENGYNILLEGISSYPKHKSVYCVTTNKKYESIIEAANGNNCLPTQIIENCKGKRGPVKSLQWTYWDQENNCPKPIIYFIPKAKKNSKKIYCIENKTTYSSIGEACRNLSIDKRSLQRALSGERNGAGNLHFVYANEKHRIVEVIKKDIGKFTRVYCHETKTVFSSIQDAALFCNKSIQSVMKNCQKKTKICGNYHFDYVKNLSDKLLLLIYNGGIEEDV